MRPNKTLLRLTILHFFFFAFLVACSKKKDNTLKLKTNKELFDLITTTSDKEEQEVYIQLYLNRAKKKNDIDEIALGYHFLMNNRYGTDEVLIYADSIINLTSQNSLNLYPAVAYQAKGDYYHSKKAHKKALENHLLVSFFAKKHNQDHMLFRSNHNIAGSKRLVGDFKEALSIAKENLTYPKENREKITDREYLVSLASVAYLFNDLENVDSATQYNLHGVRESAQLKNKLFYHNFALNQAITAYHNREFEVAIDSFQKHLPELTKFEDLQKKLPYRLYIYLFYFGKSHYELNQQEKGIEYFKLVDSLFVEEKILFPTITDTYAHLIEYYKENNDPESQLTYLNRLFEVNNILHSQEIYLNRGILTEYDIPKLKAQNEDITKRDAFLRNIILILSIFVFILIVSFGTQYKKRQLYKKRFQEIIENDKSSNKKEVVEKSDAKKINVPDHIIKDILKGLDTFEKKKEFISNKTSLIFLAKKLATNPNYLSKVINHYKKCSFTKYLNNLRIEYTIEQLKENSTYRKYTIKAIASEVGFNNVQSFAKAFYNSKGINPSFFMKELKKVS